MLGRKKVPSESQIGDLFYYISVGDDASKIKKFLEKFPDSINEEFDRGYGEYTPLLPCLAAYGRDNMMRELISKGADLEAKDKKGRTAVQAAAFYGNKSTVDLLRDYGAFVDEQKVATLLEDFRIEQEQRKRENERRFALGTTLAELEMIKAAAEREIAKVKAELYPPEATPEKVAEKAPAATKKRKTPTVDYTPKSEDSFVLPHAQAGIKNQFNTLGNKAEPVEVKAISVLNTTRDVKQEDLVDFRSALIALATPGISEHNLHALHSAMSAGFDTLPDDIKESVDVYQRKAFDILKGKSDSGFSFQVLQVAGADGSPCALYILEDRMENTLLVVGSEPITKKLKEEIERDGITYLVNSDPGAREQINTFVTHAVRERQANGMIQKGASAEITENLIVAFGYLNRFPEEFLIRQDGDAVIKERTSLGDILTRAPAPDHYTSLVKKKGQGPVI